MDTFFVIEIEINHFSLVTLWLKALGKHRVQLNTNDAISLPLFGIFRKYAKAKNGFHEVR